MCAFQICITVDSSLGRVDYSSMSDQTLMEMLIDGFDAKTRRRYKDSDGMYLDVCEWSNIKCDDDQRVIEIDIENKNSSGSVEFFYVPPKVNAVNIRSLRIRWPGQSTSHIFLKEFK